MKLDFSPVIEFSSEPADSRSSKRGTGNLEYILPHLKC